MQIALLYPVADAITVALKVPGARPEELIPKDNEPRAADGNITHDADLVSLIVGIPVLAERVEDLFAVLPFCRTENERDAGENDSIFSAVTVSVICNVALAYLCADAVTVEL